MPVHITRGMKMMFLILLHVLLVDASVAPRSSPAATVSQAPVGTVPVDDPLVDIFPSSLFDYVPDKENFNSTRAMEVSCPFNLVLRCQLHGTAGTNLYRVAFENTF